MRFQHFTETLSASVLIIYLRNRNSYKQSK